MGVGNSVGVGMIVCGGRNFTRLRAVGCVRHVERTGYAGPIERVGHVGRSEHSRRVWHGVLAFMYSFASSRTGNGFNGKRDSLRCVGLKLNLPGLRAVRVDEHQIGRGVMIECGAGLVVRHGLIYALVTAFIPIEMKYLKINKQIRLNYEYITVHG